MELIRVGANGTGANWMHRLAVHYRRVRERRPEGRLMVAFDIDGTILDMRHAVLQLLRSFDFEHGTSHFESVAVEDIGFHESKVEQMLQSLRVHTVDPSYLSGWFKANLWTSDTVLASHRPFAGVMEVIRWFQIQPDTVVGLNTGRPEEMRGQTLEVLNRLGAEYKVQFRSDLVHMNAAGWGREVERSKVEGIRRFQQAGHIVFAFVDNEPENLARVAESGIADDIVLLHADTLFESRRRRLPESSASGNRYDLTALATEDGLPRHVQFVWHGINDEVNLRQFLASNVAWGECDVRLDGHSQELVLRHDPIDSPAPGPDGGVVEELRLAQVLEACRRSGKSLKLDIKEGGATLDRLVEFLCQRVFDERLWFNANIDAIGKAGFERLARIFPDAIVQCPIDFLSPLAGEMPRHAMEVIDELAGWGLSRFSLRWSTPDKRVVLDLLDSRGYEFNIYAVPDLESFLRAALLLPTSITADFNFPQWHYYGRGSGENSTHHRYSLQVIA